MSLSTIIYLASLSDKLSSGFFTGGLSAIVFLFTFLSYQLVKGATINKKLYITFLIVCFMLILTSVVLPSKDTVYLMIGADGVQNVVNTPEAAKTRKAINLGLDKIINNLQESSNSEK